MQTCVYHIVTKDNVCCSVLQCAAVCCSVLQCAAVCCSVLQCAAVWCSVLQCAAVCCSVLQCAAVCCSVVQYGAVCCSVLKCAVACCSVFECAAMCLQCAAVCCSVLQCVVVCCSRLQCAAVCCGGLRCVAWMSHVTRMNESCRTYIRIWMSNVTRISSRAWRNVDMKLGTNEWVISHMYLGAYAGIWICSWARIRMSLITEMKVSCRTYIRIWMSHVAHVSAYECVMSHTYLGARWNMDMQLGTNTNESCHACEWVMSHMYLHMNESCHTCI